MTKITGSSSESFLLKSCTSGKAGGLKKIAGGHGGPSYVGLATAPTLGP